MGYLIFLAGSLSLLYHNTLHAMKRANKGESTTEQSLVGALLITVAVYTALIVFAG